MKAKLKSTTTSELRASIYDLTVSVSDQGSNTKYSTKYLKNASHKKLSLEVRLGNIILLLALCRGIDNELSSQ